MNGGSPSLRDLATILVHPRETIRRILDGGKDRWAAPLVVLAFLCTTVNDPDWRRINVVLPGSQTLGITAIAALGLILVAAMWVLMLFLVAWVVMLVARLFGGSGSATDTRAAIAWGFAPTIWSVILRIPIAMYETRFKLPAGPGQGREAFFNFLAQGGCALAVVLFAVQLIVFVAWYVMTSFTVAEAQRFSSPKGFATVAITCAGPVLIVLAAVFAFHH